MANVKTIIEIPVDDAAFQRFVSQFEAYSAELKEMPESWRALNAAMGDSGKELSAGALTAKDALAIAAAQAGIIAEALRDATKAQMGLGAATKGSTKGMNLLAKAAGEVGTAIESIGGWILKLGALTGIGSILGAFSFDQLAASAMNQSRSARQVGETIGGYNSFKINTQPFFASPDAALASAENALTDIRQSAGPLSVLFRNAGGYKAALAMRPDDLAVNALLKVAQKLQGIPQSKWQMQPAYAAYMQLGGNQSDVFNLLHTPGGMAQLRADQAAMHGQASGMDIPNATVVAMQNFKKNLDSAGVTIENSLINKLVPLEPILQKMTTDVSNAILAFIKSGDMTKTVDLVIAGLTKMDHFLVSVNWVAVGNDINAFATKVGWLVGKNGAPGDFVQNADSLFASVLFGPLGMGASFLAKQGDNGGKAAPMIARAINWIHSTVGQGEDTWKYITGGGSAVTSNAAKAVFKAAMELGVPPQLAFAIAQRESGMNPNKHYLDAANNGSWDTGLFALNSGGEGAGYNWKDLLNPYTNAKIGLTNVAAVIKEYMKDPQNIMNRFSTLVRADYPNATHAEIMAYAGTIGELAVVAQRPGGLHGTKDVLEYAAGINNDQSARDMTARIVKAIAASKKTPRSQRGPKRIGLVVVPQTASRFNLIMNQASYA